MWMSIRARNSSGSTSSVSSNRSPRRRHEEADSRAWGLPGHGNEPHGEHALRLEALFGAFDDPELLVDRADGNHHPAPDRELFEQRSWHFIGCRGHDDSVEGRDLGQATVAVTGDDGYVVVAVRLERFFRPLGERWEDLDRVHVARQPGENRRLVAGAGPDLQDPVFRLRVEKLRHDRHDVRLRDRLFLADGERMVRVGHGSYGLGHEEMPRHGSHGFEHPGVRNASRFHLALHHRKSLAVPLLARWSAPRGARSPKDDDTSPKGICQENIHTLLYRFTNQANPRKGS